MEINGIQIQPQTKSVLDSNRTVRVSDLLCKRCQKLIGYVFWDLDHSALEEKTWKSKKAGKCNFEQKEYVKLYKHCIMPCLDESEAELESESLSDLMNSNCENSLLSSSPILGSLLTNSDSFEVLMAKFFKHQAQESFYRFIVSCDSPSSENKVFGLIRLLATSATILLSDKNLSLSEDFGWAQTEDEEADTDQIWGGPQANGCLNMYPIVRLNYLECPREKTVDKLNAWDDCLDGEAELLNSMQQFNAVVNSWKKVSLQLCPFPSVKNIKFGKSDLNFCQ